MLMAWRGIIGCGRGPFNMLFSEAHDRGVRLGRATDVCVLSTRVSATPRLCLL